MFATPKNNESIVFLEWQKIKLIINGSRAYYEHVFCFNLLSTKNSLIRRHAVEILLLRRNLITKKSTLTTQSFLLISLIVKQCATPVLFSAGKKNLVSFFFQVIYPLVLTFKMQCYVAKNTLTSDCHYNTIENPIVYYYFLLNRFWYSISLSFARCSRFVC